MSTTKDAGGCIVCIFFEDDDRKKDDKDDLKNIFLMVTIRPWIFIFRLSVNVEVYFLYSQIVIMGAAIYFDNGASKQTGFIMLEMNNTVSTIFKIAE